MGVGKRDGLRAQITVMARPVRATSPIRVADGCGRRWPVSRGTGMVEVPRIAFGDRRMTEIESGGATALPANAMKPQVKNTPAWVGPG